MGSVLVVGAGGVAGSSLVRQLLRESDVSRVVAWDSAPLRGGEVWSGCEPVAGDPRLHLVSGESVTAEEVVRLAQEAQVGGLFWIPQPVVVREDLAGIPALVEEGRLLVEFCLRQRMPLLLLSSAEVYGSSVAPDLAKEGAPLHPGSYQAVAQAAVDQMAAVAAASSGLDLVLARSTAVYGPGASQGDWLYELVRGILGGELGGVAASGMEIRDWIHAEDLAKGLVGAWRRGKTGQVYHFGGRCERTVQGIVREIARILARPEIPLQSPPGASDSVARYALDIEKSKMWFGWEPQMEFRKAFPELIRAMAQSLE